MSSRGIESMRLHKLMDETEFLKFREQLCEVSEKFKDIIGVLAVGSLVQSTVVPEEFYFQKRGGELGSAYEQIRNPERSNPSLRFTDEQYRYYSRNLIHTPDNNVELAGLFKIMGIENPD